MARQFYGFFDSTAGDEREYVAEEFAQYFRSFFTDGVKEAGTNLQVVLGSSGMAVRILPGIAMLQGYFYGLFDDGGEPLELTLDEAEALPRIDRIILRLDRSTSARSITPLVLHGTPAASPVPPALTRTGILWEISLAQVLVHSAELAAEDITDEREDADVCGVVTLPRLQQLLDQGVRTIDSPAFQALEVFDDLGVGGSISNTLLASGWTRVSQPWTYASATTINVPSGAASIFQRGDKLKLSQGGAVKYFYIVGVADTLLTVTGGSDYTITGTAITDVYFSKESNPHGFPHWFAFTPAIQAEGSMTFTPTTYNMGRFALVGGVAYVQLYVVGEISGTPSSYIAFAPPVEIVGGTYSIPFSALVRDAGSGSLVMGLGNSSSAAYGIRIYKFDRSNWSAGTDRIIAAYFSYPCY